MKRLFSILLILTMLLGLPMPVSAFDSEKATSKNLSSVIWSRLDLSKLPAVQSAINNGNETLAKEELLSYYIQKFAKANPQPGSSIKGAMVYLTCRNTLAFSEPYLNYVDVTSTTYAKYTINLIGNKTGNYVLSMIDKTVGEIVIPSREDSSMAPKLVIGCTDGTTKTLTPIADTYVRAGKSAASNYGSSTTLYAHDDYSGTIPYGDNTKRIYLRFDTAQIPANGSSVKLEVYAKRSGGSEGSLRLHAFGAYATAWTETKLTWNWLIDTNCLAHISWNNMEGGFDWTIPKGVPSQWTAYNTRFYEVTSLVQTALKEGKASANYHTYMTTAKNWMLDFIRDAGAGKPDTKQDLDPANRLLEFPYIYKHLLAENFLTPDENITLLNWVWEETEFLSNRSYLFSSANQPLSDLAFYHGFRHLTGFYQGGGFFPEFKASELWRNNYASRQETVVNALVLEDGAYNTISFGYPSEMVNCGVVLLTAMAEAGDYSTAYAIKTKLIKLAKYMVDCSQPNGILPYWGQGAPSSAKPVVQTVLNAIGDSMDGNPIVADLRAFVQGMDSCHLDTSSQFDISKIAVDRSGWGSEDTMLFMNAKCSGNHAHRDALALLLYFEGRQLLTDTGMTSYDSTHAHFNWQNSITRSHNTIEVDGKAQTLYLNLEDVPHMGSIDMRAGSALTTITAWSDANNNDTSTKSLSMDGVINHKDFHSTDFRHNRDVSFIKALGDMVIVTDKIVPEDSALHSYTQNWHCAPYSNATVRNDSYGTGTTDYEKGPNLIIAQAGGETPAIRSGYDSTASSAPTKYFEYQQTKSGAVTYQTVLYPVSAGASATVKPTKLTMSNTADETALAMSIAISDSAKPQLKTVYHYHSFEETPSLRNFGSYTTNGRTALLALTVHNQISFAAITEGSSLQNEEGVILSASGKVSDLTASLEGNTLYIEGGDSNLAFLEIQANFSGQSVQAVLLNGEDVSFTQSSDGTVIISGSYLLSHFDEGDLFTHSQDWSTNLTTATLDTVAGLLTGTINGHDPFVYTKNIPTYKIQKGDVVELRIKNSILSGSYTPLQLFYMTDHDTGFSGSKCMGHSATSYPADEFVTVRLAFPTSVQGQMLKALRIDMVGATRDNPATGSYAIDYIYVGPANTAPSCYENSLFFDFTNTHQDRLRYTAKSYGDRNYDTNFWSVNTKRCSKPLFDGEHMILEIAETTDHYSATGVTPFVQTSNASMTLANHALDYCPKADDYVQIRFSLHNCDVAVANPAVRLYFNTDDSGAMTDQVTRNLALSDLTSGKFLVVTFPFSEAPSYATTQRLRGLRLNFPNVCSLKGKTGVILIDYIYVGAKETLPIPIHTITFQNHDGTSLSTQKCLSGETAIYSGVAPTRAYDATCHYNFAGWDHDLENIRSDLTVTALYTEIPHSFCYTNLETQEHQASCICGYRKSENHTVVVDKAVAPTCTATGLTEGTHCSVCSAVLVAQETVPSTGHSYTYAKADDQSHTVGCKNCPLSETAPHSYQDGFCICGAEEVKEPVLETGWKIGHTLNLASDISVTMAISKASLSGFDMDTVYVLAQRDVYEGNVKIGVKTIVIHPEDKGSYYYFTLTGLTAVHMNDQIRSVLYGTKDGQVHYSPVDEYSIATYAYAQMNKTAATEKLKTLCADLLRYGGKAQIFKGYRTDSLADAAMTEVQKNYLSDLDAVTFGNTNTTENIPATNAVQWLGKSLDLASKVSVKFIFSLGSYTGNTEDLTMKVTYKDINGKDKEKIITDLEVYNASRGYYAFTLDSLLVAELRSVLTVQILSGDTVVSGTVQYAADTYGNGKSGTLGDLCKALFAYSDSAKAFFVK